GLVRNPVNPDFVAGGSSGGSTAAVASGMCYAAIGTDTAGSIREPAALCGIVGLKPTFDLVSTSGIIPLSQSLDHAGPIKRCVELYQPETRRRIKAGERVTEVQYQTALRELQQTRAEIAEKFREIDVLVTPTTPVPSPRISDLISDQALLRPAELLLLRNTRPVNGWGLPAISL